ncbi:hypothetical protein I3843_09G037900 [Carya illinoinensis]|uniref:Insulin-degrading enzyme-like 1, peroxisomal n=1 Tax=Carya illinoinensis TaxID=32201 RepID=A0A922E135_CARIL|nr:hypothetical protein I3760_09G037100 [Carya illinoinensis]KAG6694212.1 hypothetical protein I3842_09G037400 [Carya illinoinensis]KAG7961877.1 hypothetical protein I3843_09G037900 [Carya illinoinensis]
MAAGKGEAEIVQARTDKREYRRIVLKNSLEALLISDPDTDKCAATMDVGVGSFSDPEGLEGLAHFLEHMLFYASEKYPLEDSYSKYIIEHGGRTNAFTASEHTNYHFDVNTDCFEEALDRFAQFFIKPLMSADATMREIKAVDSENQKNLLSDAWRMNQLQKHLSMEGHPYHKFSTGSLDTLEVRPKARGLDTRLELLKFYKENYSANLMHLVVYAKENLDKIENMVEQKFQDIQNANRSCFRCPGPPCTPEHLQILVRAVPIKEGHKLRIVWPITPEILHYKEGPCRYLGSSLPSMFNPGTIERVLEELSIDNVRIFWESKKFEGHTDKVEPWYETPYSVEKITSSMIQEWVLGAPNENLHLPAANVFIPTDLSLKNAQEVEFPVLLRESSRSRLWYKPDTKFSTPKAYVKMDFNCPHAGNSPEAEVLTDLFTRLLMDYLNEYAYYAQVAGLYYGINQTDCGFQVTLVGYNHKLRALLDTVLAKIAKFKVKADRFSVIKEMVTKEYQNFKFQQPYQQAMYYCSLILQDHTWPWMEELEVLPHLEAEDLAKFAPVMLSRAFLECYIAGNIESSEAESMVQHVEDVFFSGSKPICQPLFPSQHVTNRVVKLERGMSYFYSAEGLNPNDDNSALVHYIQVHRDDFLLNVKLQLFALIAKQPAFHQLRSVEQLGYITVLMKRNDSGIHGVQFIIQSTVKGPGNIDLRVEAFLKTFESKIYEMTDDEFKNNVNALIDMKLEKYKNLREESGFYWREIYYGTLKFDRKESEVAALRKLTQQELIDFFNDYIKVGATQRKSLSVGVYGNLHNSEYKADHASEPGPYSVKIDNIFSFRRSQALYGSFRGVTGHVKL